MTAALGMFLLFVLVTLGITYWAARRSQGAAAFFTASRRITGWQNGVAVAGDYMSAASFLGIAGLIAFFGYDGFMFSVGFLVAYLTVLLVVAEPLRNAGKYTMADLLAFRLSPRPVRALASLSTLVVSTFYMIAQMVGAGGIIKGLIGIEFVPAVIGVGVLVRFYTVPNAKTARMSVVWAMFIIGAFYIMTTFFGFGAATILHKADILTAAGKENTNMVAPILARALGGELFFSFISAVAFA